MDVIANECASVVCLALHIEAAQCHIKSLHKHSIRSCKPRAKLLGKDVYLVYLQQSFTCMCGKCASVHVHDVSFCLHTTFCLSLLFLVTSSQSICSCVLVFASSRWMENQVTKPSSSSASLSRLSATSLSSCLSLTVATWSSNVGPAPTSSP